MGHTYLWNRAERVRKEDMPHVVIDAFKTWRSDLQKEWRYLTEPRKKALKYRVVREQRKMNENLYRLGYEEYKD